MADDIDKAQEQMEVIARANIENRHQPTAGLTPCGECHYCGEEVDGDKLYCNGDHASRHHRQLKMRGLL
jgi:hypothetical protein